MALTEHHFVIYLLQFSLILFMARGLGELAKRLNQPPVIGEILAGVVLGPSVLGRLLPGFFAVLFPQEGLQPALLEITAWFGMVMLLLVTGLETDIQIMGRLGKPALLLAGLSLSVPFVAGLILATFLPGSIMAGPIGKGGPFVLFMGIVFSVTAVPLLAKILLELKVMKRDLGPALLGAAMVQAALGWILLSVLTSVVHGSGSIFLNILRSVFFTAVFAVAAFKLGYPFLQGLIRWVDDRMHVEYGRLSAVLFVTLLYASITHWIGIHAIFGAFVAGATVALSTRLRTDVPDRIRSMTVGVFGPIFFAYAGLKLDLSALKDLDWFFLIFWVAVVSKVVGGYVGARMGGFRFGESLTAGIAMNARGELAMVLALIGLSMGLVSNELFAIIILIALATSLMTPPLMRAVLRFVKLTTDEAERLAKAAKEAKAHFKTSGMKVLLSTSGGPNPMGGLQLVTPLLKEGPGSLTVMAVKEQMALWETLKSLFKKRPEHQLLENHLNELKKTATEAKVPVETRLLTRPSAKEAILEEAERGYDLVVLGTAGARHPLASETLREVVVESPCDVVLVKRRQSSSSVFHKILVPYKGDALAHLALEFAALYARAAQTEVTLFHVVVPLLPITTETFQALAQHESFTQKEEIQKLMSEEIQRVGQTFNIQLHTKIQEGHVHASVMIQEAQQGGYDLIVLAAQHHILKQRLFFGNVIEDIVNAAPCSVAVLSPKGK